MSIKKIAELAGVSIATVSNVLNGTGRVSEETAKLVKAAASSQNLALRPKRRNFSADVRRIAFAAADDLMNSQRSFFRMRLVDGIQSWLDEAGYSLVHSSRVTKESINHQTRDAAAVILIGFDENPEALAVAAGKPVIWALRNHCDAADIVQEDNMMVAKLVVGHLLSHGHRHFGYMDDELVETVVERGRFAKNFVEGAEAKITIARGRGIFSRDDRGNGVDIPQAAKLMDKLFARKNPPTCLFVPGDLLSVIVYSLLRERGLEPGRDVEVVSCNSVEPYATNLTPRPAVIDLNLETVGRRAAEVAIWRLANPGEPPIRLLVRPTLILPKE